MKASSAQTLEEGPVNDEDEGKYERARSPVHVTALIDDRDA